LVALRERSISLKSLSFIADVSDQNHSTPVAEAIFRFYYGHQWPSISVSREPTFRRQETRPITARSPYPCRLNIYNTSRVPLRSIIYPISRSDLSV